MEGFIVNPYTYCLNCGKPTVQLYDMVNKIVYARNMRDIKRVRTPLSHAECSSCKSKFFINFADDNLIKLVSSDDINFIFDIH